MERVAAISLTLRNFGDEEPVLTSGVNRDALLGLQATSETSDEPMVVDNVPPPPRTSVVVIKGESSDTVHFYD